MADYIELELKTFELSSGDSRSSLSVTSLALISGLPPLQCPSEELYQLIQSKQLWLVSPGFCRIQIIVCQNRLSMTSDESEVGFLEHLADAICQCSLWPTLGLTIKQEDIQCQPPYDGAPNLYFIVEHPQKSSLLLSPPHSPTARFNGIECLFRYQSDNPEAAYSATERYDICDTDMDDYSPETTLQLEDLNHTYEGAMLEDYWDDPIADPPINQAQQRWDDAAYLAQMALHVTIGIKKRMRGLRLFQLDSRPSLLEIAPAIWNARYLEAVTSHVANFSIISNILATSSRGQSSSLRQKSAKLLMDVVRSDQPRDGTKSEGDLNQYRSSVQQRLWSLLQTTLKPTIRMKNANISVISQRRESTNEAFEFMPMETDGLDEFENSSVNVFENSSVNVFDGTSSDNTSFNNVCDDVRPLHEYVEYQTEDDSNESDRAIEYRQWWYRREDLRLGATHAIGEESQPVQTNYESDLNHQYSFPSWPSSSSEELHDTSTVHQYVSTDFIESVIDVDNIHSSTHFYDVDTDYGTMNEISYMPEGTPSDGTRQDYVYGDDSYSIVKQGSNG
ncbi:hypothetical protein F4781DRAFT_439651 [Annulohypoxylon bovei var. microspora]|nr:hypothetical protein F4781DRAFT_439651 [Annulohypoxylon bovei var. microspora]